MPCQNCTESCIRRIRRMPMGHRNLCATNEGYVIPFDGLYGVADDSIIPDSVRQREALERQQKSEAVRPKPVPRSIVNNGRANPVGGPKPVAKVVPPTKELGDVVESALTAVGITSDRVSSWLGRPCGCTERKQKLNNLSRWARQALSTKAEEAKQLLEKMME